MARLRTVGFESRGLLAEVTRTTGNTPTIDTTVFRSGSASLQCKNGSTGGNSTVVWSDATPGGNGITVYFRAYFRLANLPSSDTQLIAFSDSGGAAQLLMGVRSTGALFLLNGPSLAQIGSDSVTHLVTGQWYRIEMSMLNSATTGTQAAELRLDGVVVASQSGLTLSTAATAQVGAGWLSNTDPSIILNIDDVAINNSTGTSQNSYPGEGHVVCLLPVGDSAVAGWTTGTGGTTNLWQAVDNNPPAGLSSTSETSTSQIKNGQATTYTASMANYTAGGVPTSATISLVQATIQQGRENTNQSDTGSLQISSNPVQAAADTFSFNSTPVVATWPSGWSTVWGTPQVGDISSGNRSTSPTLSIAKTSSGTRKVDCCFMGLMVEYVAAAVSVPHRLALLGVGH